MRIVVQTDYGTSDDYRNGKLTTLGETPIVVQNAHCSAKMPVVGLNPTYAVDTRSK